MTTTFNKKGTCTLEAHAVSKDVGFVRFSTRIIGTRGTCQTGVALFLTVLTPSDAAHADVGVSLFSPLALAPRAPTLIRKLLISYVLVFSSYIRMNIY